MTPPDQVPGAIAEAPTAQAMTPDAIAHEPAHPEPARRSAIRARVALARKDTFLSRLWLRDLTASGILAVVIRALFEHAVPWNDQTYALIWGRDIIHGRTPDLTYPFAATAHPLANALAALAAVLGNSGAVDALVVVSYLSLGAVIWGVYRLGEAVFSRPVAVLAALLVGSTYDMFAAAVSVYLDAPYLALVVWAAVLEARRPRRGTAIVVLLTVAALLRPEAAVLAAAYWLYACRRGERRWVSALILLLAPLGWVLTGLTATGHPFFTVSAQRFAPLLSGAGGRMHPHFSYGAEFTGMLNALRTSIRGPALLGAAAGVLLALRLRFAAAALPALIVVLVLLTYAAFVVLGFAVPERMLLTPGLMLALFCGFAIVGWVRCGSIVERGAWGAVGITVLALLLATAPSVFSGLRALASRQGVEQQVASDLNALESSPASRAVLRSCQPISIGPVGLVPYVSYYLDQPLRAVRIALRATPSRGTYLAPTSLNAAAVFIGTQDAQAAMHIPPGFHRVTGNRSWNVYRKGC